MMKNTTAAQTIVPEVVTILNNRPFTTREQFRFPVRDCIQFHSKALPENQVLSNHYDCIIRFRDCEFYSVEQLFLALTYSERKDILREIMKCKSGIEAKVKERRPKAKTLPALNKGKCLVLDFDYCVFDTSADDEYRKCKGKKDMEKAFEMVPMSISDFRVMEW